MQSQSFDKDKYNELCATFLGWKFENGYYNPDMHHEFSFVKPSDLKFHSDWNWIMEIVDKIETTYDKYILQWEYDSRDEFKGYTAYWFTLMPKDEILSSWTMTNIPTERMP